MVTRAKGSAMSVRIERMVAAIISSRSVKPLARFTLGPEWNLRNLIVLALVIGRRSGKRPSGAKPSYRVGITARLKPCPSRPRSPRCSEVCFLLDRDGGLCSVDRDGLQTRIARTASSDGQGSLSIGFCQESYGDDRALPG